MSVTTVATVTPCRAEQVAPVPGTALPHRVTRVTL